MNRKSAVWGGIALFFLALSWGLWESSALAQEQGWSAGAPGAASSSGSRSAETQAASSRTVMIEAARSYARPTSARLRLGYRYHQEGQLEQAQRLYEEVLWETRDSEEIAAVRELLFRLEEERSSGRPRALPTRTLPLADPILLPPVRPPQPVETLQAPSLAQAGRPLLSWLESSVPLLVELTANRMARYIEGVGERELTRTCTEGEFKQIILRSFKERFPKEMSDISATFQPDGILGAGTLHVGRLAFRVASRIGITLVDDKPQAVIYEARIGTLQVPEPILKFLEKRINRLIARRLLPLKFKRVDLRHEKAFVSVEIA